MSTHACTYTPAHVCVCAHTHVHVHARAHACTHTHQLIKSLLYVHTHKGIYSSADLDKEFLQKLYNPQIESNQCFQELLGGEPPPQNAETCDKIIP